MVKTYRMREKVSKSIGIVYCPGHCLCYQSTAIEEALMVGLLAWRPSTDSSPHHRAMVPRFVPLVRRSNDQSSITDLLYIGICFKLYIA